MAYLPVAAQRLARGQHGVLAREQLLVVDGVTRAAVDGWVRAGCLEVVHPGVYRIAGSALSQRSSCSLPFCAVGKARSRQEHRHAGYGSSRGLR